MPVAPAASVVPATGGNNVFVPASLVRIEPAKAANDNATPADPPARFGSHVYALAAGATRLPRPAGNLPIFIELTTPMASATPGDLDIRLDGASSQGPTLVSPSVPPLDPSFEAPVTSGLDPVIGRLLFDATTPQTGDDQTFWVVHPGKTPPTGEAYDEVQITAHRTVTGTHCQVFLDAGLPPLAAYTQAQIKNLADTFDQHIFDTDATLFAQPPTDADYGDARVAIVITPEVSSHGTTSALAFFLRRDLLPPNPADPVTRHSNHREVLYVDSGLLDPTRKADLLASVSHEFQHLINYHHKRIVEKLTHGEDLWLDEGLATYAAAANGYGPDVAKTMYDHVSNFLARSYLYSLTDWSGNPYGAGYGEGYLFFQYLTDRFGPDLVRELVGSNLTGKQNLDAALAKRGANFADVLSDFAVALLNTGLFRDDTGRFAFKSISLRHDTPFGSLYGQWAVPLGTEGVHIPGHPDMVYLLQFQPGAGTPVLRVDGAAKGFAIVP